MDIERVIDVTTGALLRELGEEVDLIFRYGSLLKGTNHHYSDIDVSYVPVHEETGRSITVLVDNVLLDLYPIRWSQLERMADFEDISCPVLLESRIIYQRSEDSAVRFAALGDRLRSLLEPDARPAMVRKAQAIFQQAGYPFYLLQQQAAAGHQLACLQQSRTILQIMRHCLMALNQRAIDSRKLDQVLALPHLPAEFAEIVARVTAATAPDELLATTKALMDAVRDLLLAEQRKELRAPATFPAVFHAAYPELQNDLRHVMLACERGDLYNMNLLSLYHELMIHMAQAETGVEYSGFNSIAEYAQDLAGLGFPDLLSSLSAGDLTELLAQCPAFDARLRSYLQERSVELNAFASVGELAEFLGRA